MATYSFTDIVAAITGPGGTIPLGAGTGASEGGITITASSDKNTMMIGADGSGMNSLMADSSSEVTIRLLKTSPVNFLLQQLYNFQTASALTHGYNTITVTDIVRGDFIVMTSAAFKKRPDITYAKEGGDNEWVFDAIKTTQILGIGTPEIA
jgi:hypothetical protein